MATLSEALLTDIHKGVASIGIIPVSDSTLNFEPTALSFANADFLFTIKDSFTISEDEATEEEIKIDQGDAVIATDIEPGTLSFNGNCPISAVEIFEYFYNAGSTSVTATGKDGDTYTGKGFLRTPKEIEVTALVESESKKSAILFAKVKIRGRMVHDDMDNPLYIAFTGTVLTNPKSGKGDFAILKAAQGN